MNHVINSGLRDPDVDIVVYSVAQPAGSKSRNAHKGVRDSNPKSRGYKDRVAQVAGEQYHGPLLSGALAVSMTFYVPRNIGHYGTGKNAGIIRASAPAYPTVRPDVLKRARGVEDALTGVLWRDDAQIVTEHLAKRYGEPARCQIYVWALEPIAAGVAA